MPSVLIVMDRVLVTGGAGFIGSHTVDLLLARGYGVRILDNLQPRVHPQGVPSWIPAGAELVVGDVTDAAVLAKALEGMRYVVHLAAYQDYMPDFSKFIDTNTRSSALLFELIVADRARFPVRKIVLASSQSVSGEGCYYCSRCGGKPAPSIDRQLADPSLLEELPGHGVLRPGPRPANQLLLGRWELLCPRCDHELVPLLIGEATVSPGTAYAISKYAIELLADRLGQRYEVPTACLRYTYVQGPRNSYYNAYSGIARRFALRLLAGRAPVLYEDGKQLRDYVNVLDVARANVLALEDARTDFGVFNVGGGKAVSVGTFARLMIDAFASACVPEISGEFRVGDTRHTVSDISRLAALGWSPTVSVEENVREYVAWIRMQPVSAHWIADADRTMRDQGVVRSATGPQN